MPVSRWSNSCATSCKTRWCASCCEPVSPARPRKMTSHQLRHQRLQGQDRTHLPEAAHPAAGQPAFIPRHPHAGEQSPGAGKSHRGLQGDLRETGAASVCRRGSGTARGSAQPGRVTNLRCEAVRLRSAGSNSGAPAAGPPVTATGGCSFHSAPGHGQSCQRL